MKRTALIIAGGSFLFQGALAQTVLFEADFESGTTANTGTIVYDAGYNVQTPVTSAPDATLGSYVLLADPTSGGAAATEITWTPTAAASLVGGQSAVVSLDVAWWRNNGSTKSHYLTGYDSDDNIIFRFVMADSGEFGNGGADRQRPGYVDSSGRHAFTADEMASGATPGSYWFGADTNPDDGLNPAKDAHFEITVSSWGWSLYAVKQDGTTTAQTATLATYNGTVHSELAYVRLTGESAAAGAWFDNLTIQSVEGADLLPDIWFDAEQGLQLDGGYVAAWTNLASPGSYDAVQAAASKRPQLMYEIWPGHQVLHFDGTDDILSLANTAGNELFEGELTVFFVGRRDTGGSFSGSDGFFGNFQTGNGFKNGWTLRAGPDGTYGFVAGNGAWNEVEGGVGELGEDFVLLNARYSDAGDGTGTMELFSSRLESPATAETSPFTISPSSVDISIGMFCGWTATDFTQPVACDVAEIRIYGRALSDTERESVWNELAATYSIGIEQTIVVNDFQPTGYEEPTDTPVRITFNTAMDPDSMTNVIVGIGGLDGLPEGCDWTHANGSWAASADFKTFTFTADPTFPAGELILCEIPDTVLSAGGTPYETSERETWSFIVDNGVSYGITVELIDPMAIVLHNNGDEHILPLELHLPTAAAESCPVMFWVHGGGWTGGGGGTWDKSAIKDANMAYYYADKLGVAVANVSWRAMTASDGTFTKATNDIAQAVQYVKDNAEAYNIDASRMGLYGGSAGTPTSSLVSQANTNISCYIGFNGLYNFSNRSGTGSWGGGTAFGQNDPSYAANSAALNVRANPPDSLFLHGDADTTIEHEQSEWYADAIVAAGGSAEALIYRDEVHAFFNDGQDMHFPTMHASGEFLNRVFGLGYAQWTQANELTEGDGGDDDGDGVSNLVEYGLGGDPADTRDAGIFPSFGKSGSVMRYVYPRRTSDDCGITYSLELCDNLVSNDWNSAGFVESGSGAVSDAFELVTNEIPTLGNPQQFVRLRIERD